MLRWIILALVLLATAHAEPAKFTCYKGDPAANSRIVDLLDGLKIERFRVEKSSLTEAIRKLNRDAAGEGNEAVINFVVRQPKGKRKPGLLTLDLKATTFARAIDRICGKAGHQWTLDTEDPQRPVLVLSPEPAI